MKWIFLIIVAGIFYPATTKATVYLASSCDGTEVTITLDVFNDLGASFDGLPIVIEKSLVGVCDPTELITAPMVMPAYPSGDHTTFSFAVSATDQFYAFVAFVELTDGTLHQLFRGVHAAACGEAIAARGYLVYGGDGITYVPCPDNCWTGVVSEGGSLDFLQLPSDEYLPYVGADIVVDLYGRPLAPTPMPGDPGLTVTRVEPAVDGACGPVPAATESWGSIKAQYR